MKIALIGYGKMGKAIEQIALNRGHQIVLQAMETPTSEEVQIADVAIEFSTPETAFQNIKTCLESGIPVLSGTTGWLDKKSEIEAFCTEKNGTFLYASNFSIGVNLFFELNKKLAHLMKNIPDYQVSMEEIHHTQKLDSPSGTAITLANDILPIVGKKEWILAENSNQTAIAIDAKRIENVPGTHSVFYRSSVDEIEIKHTAFSREGFALGAVLSAEFLKDKKGIFQIKDVLNIG